MAKLNVKPTRGELAKLKDRLSLATRGHKLLKDKQDELMRQFIILIRQNNELRQSVEAKLVAAMQEFTLAKTLETDQIVQEIFSVPNKEVDLYIDEETIMSVGVPRFHIDVSDTAKKSDMEYSYLASNSGMDDAIEATESSLNELLELAEIEKTCQLMADEIEKTRRRVNGLEYQTIPNLEETIHFIEMKLEEAERASITRMMKVKDMN
ncbi:V-type ATP synthase subunit D [Aerococcaceae bacterium DSM 111176]|nr:V-type ATP synthase subunit D [Aerococcaceae bacterium DSM 111176]